MNRSCHCPNFDLLILSSSVSAVYFSFHLNIYHHTAQAPSLCCSCRVPCDNLCHVKMLGLSYVSSCLISFSFHFVISLCSSPDCMLVSQATFQSKHYYFFCSSNIHVHTFPQYPDSFLVSCCVEMSEPSWFNLSPA